MERTTLCVGAKNLSPVPSRADPHQHSLKPNPIHVSLSVPSPRTLSLRCLERVERVKGEG